VSQRFAQFAALSLVGIVVVLLLVVVFQRVNRDNLERHFNDHNVLLGRLLRNGLQDQGLLERLRGDLRARADSRVTGPLEAALRA
jgi:hypothetical protein